MSRTDETAIVVDGDLPLVESVKAADKFQVEVCWQNRVDNILVDLAPDILTFKVYARLRHDRNLFENIAIGDEGNTLSWADGGIEMPATAVERLANEKMSAENMRAFMHAANLTRDGLAAQLGVSRRLVGYWLTGQTIPRYIMLACKSLGAEAQAGVRRGDRVLFGRWREGSIDETVHATLSKDVSRRLWETLEDK